MVGYTVSIGLVIFLILGLSLAYQLRHGAEQAQVAMSITGGLVALLLGGGFAAVKYTNWGLQLWLKIVANYAEHGGIVIILILGLLSLLLAVFGSRYGKKTRPITEKSGQPHLEVAGFFLCIGIS